jgi:hypothetical protein
MTTIRAMTAKPTPELTFAARFEEPAEDGRRRFTGVAYSGQLISRHWAWGDLIFDLSTVEHAERVPVLVEHDRSQRAGVIDTFSVSDERGLEVSGYLLDNAHGKTVADDADAGFPWQMSVNIEPARVEEIPRGDVTVNGYSLKAPVTVFRNGAIREVSFTPTGADRHTSATVFTHQEAGSMPGQDQGDNTPDVTALEARIAELEQENQGLRDQFSARVRDERVRQFAALMEVKPDEVEAEVVEDIGGMSDRQFSLLMARAKPAAPPALPDTLFAEQATNGQSGNDNTMPLTELVKQRFSA